jgi:serine/threonine-protein kinase RsbT
MATPDVAANVVAALNQYFSAPIAKALLTTTARRASLDVSALDRAGIPQLLAALERTLPMYLADPSRRKECLDALWTLAPPASPDRSEPPASPAPVPSTVIHVRTPDDVVNACDAGRDICRRTRLTAVAETKVATAIAELARNLLQHAGSGEIRLTAIGPPRPGIEIAAVDRGRGIADVAAVMSNAYRSRTGMGMGLKGTKRLMDQFEITSAPGAGTTVVARKFAS